jgi:hypothetical protein
MIANETLELLHELAVEFKKLLGPDAKPAIISDDINKLSDEELVHEIIKEFRKLLGSSEKKN